MNKNFKNEDYKVGQRVVCTSGMNKGKIFIIEAVIRNGYSCSLEGSNDNTYYFYSDGSLREATENDNQKISV